MLRRLVVPVLLLVVAVGAGIGAARADAGGETAVATAPFESPRTPLLSARRVPEHITAPIADRRLRADLEALVPSLPAATCLVVDAGGRPMLAHQPGRALVPASNEKVLLAAAALEELGPTHRFVTTLRASAPAGPDGVIAGDVWLVGGGDPVLATRPYTRSSVKQAQAATALEDLADRLAAAGVTEIRGRVLGDESRYDRARYVDAWPPRFIDQNQTGPLSALSVNDGFATFPTRSDPGVEEAPAPDPAAAGARTLVGLLADRGVRVTGGAGSGPAPAQGPQLARVRSAPLRDITAQLLTWSDNHTAELLLKELGLARRGEGTTAAGAAAVEEILAESGFDLSRADAVDGSGLAGANRVTCALLHEILADAGPRSPLIGGLAVAGETGTLAATFNGTAAEGRLRAKSGSLNEVRSLSGVVSVPRGDDLTFALVVNEPAITPEGDAVPVEVGVTLARYPDRPPLAQVGPRPVPR